MCNLPLHKSSSLISFSRNWWRSQNHLPLRCKCQRCALAHTFIHERDSPIGNADVGSANLAGAAPVRYRSCLSRESLPVGCLPPIPRLRQKSKRTHPIDGNDQDVGCCGATHGSVRGGCSISSLRVAIPVVEWMGLAHSPCCTSTRERSPDPIRSCPTKTPTHVHGGRAFCR